MYKRQLLYLKKHKISSYIKLQDHEKRKTRAYTEELGKYYNMKTQIFEDELYYICPDVYKRQVLCYKICNTRSLQSK